jgi:hypothetical protein
MSIFANAKALKAPAAAKGKKTENEVELPGLENYALVDALIKSLEGVKLTLASQLKSDAREHFLAEGTDRRPENFKAVDGSAKASIVLGKRSTKSVLNEEEVELLTAAGVPVEIVDDVAETFVINPAYAKDSALLGKIEKALKKVPGLPVDFILAQEGKSRTVVSDKTVEAVFTKGLAEQFIDTVCVLSVTPKLENPNLKAALELAKKFVK